MAHVADAPDTESSAMELAVPPQTRHKSHSWCVAVGAGMAHTEAREAELARCPHIAPACPRARPTLVAF